MNEREALNDIVSQADIRQVLKRLRETFGVRADQAWNLVKENKVKRYVFKPSGKIVWTVVGETDEHLIYEVVGYCHCEDFFFKFDTGYICQHIIAQKLAERKGRFERIEKKDEEYDQFMNHWRLKPRTRILETLQQRPTVKMRIPDGSVKKLLETICECWCLHKFLGGPEYQCTECDQLYQVKKVKG